ncbi:thioredoxin-disulfide reductase [Candidatus Palauibacter soopunensis]|uniref:thioredoxin-disulfide reductase n=1 Tax=Candidatus Palauibacter soopunensis TaxID=3056739 RepID=UPI0023A36861|nr:thioredoxin-disulfide reductase [Candidatus Palauibacter soopunensis]MDE2878368.1 thioredoxin-disulfide reductase [Candidatus Palauibacter soopunensis]
MSTENVVIIGSGPAAWTAAIYAARANLNPLVFEGAGSRTMIPGGQLMFTTDVENYPGFPEGVSGIDMMLDFKKQALRFDTRVFTEDIVEVDFSDRPFLLRSSGGQEVRAETVIVATGANARWLGVPGEERLAQSGGGVSACAVCDGALPVFRDQVLAVVGGGDSAMEEALYLTKFASEVLLIHRRDELRASQIMQERAFASDKIRFLWNRTVEEVFGDDAISGLRLRDTVTGETSEVQVGGMFVAIGHIPNTAFLRGQVDLKENGYVDMPTPWRTETNVPGVFAAGDVMDDYYRQAVSAAGTGCMAALDAERFLAHNGSSG